MAWMLIFFYLLLITPVRLGIALSLGEGARVTVGIMIWGVSFQAAFWLERDQRGVLRWMSTLPRMKERAEMNVGGRLKSALQFLRALKKADGARGNLRRCVQVRMLEIRAKIHLPHAGQAALASAFLQSLMKAIPVLRGSIQPAFREKSALQARCIFDSRLGMLCSAGLLGLFSYRLAAKKEEEAWIIPSGN